MWLHNLLYYHVICLAAQNTGRPAEVVLKIRMRGSQVLPATSKRSTVGRARIAWLSVKRNETTNFGPIIALPRNQGYSNVWTAIRRLFLTNECLVRFCLQISQGKDVGFALLSLHVVIRRAFIILI